MKTFAALFKTEDGKSLADVDGPVYIVAGDSVGPSNQIRLTWMQISDGDVSAYVHIASRVCPEAAYQTTVGRPDVQVLRCVFSTEAAALASIAEEHMQKALAFTRKATSAGGGK